MGYGRLNARQRKALAKIVRGRIVHDLGAGDLELSCEMLKLGAHDVYAIDKSPKPHLSPWPKRLHYKQDYFSNITGRFDVAFLSWPINHEVNLIPLVSKADVIAYLGKNTDGSMCGTPSLFGVMIRRELLAYVPDRHNCLIVVGKYLDTLRPPTGEEQAGLTITTSYYSYENAEALGF